jgi:selT/selW/selH-like putative selenoprotein
MPGVRIREAAMKVVITYCAPCNYEPRARSIGAKFESSGAEVAYVRSHGGVLDIALDGQLKFSKKQTGRFPTDEEVEALAKSAAPSRT